MSGCYEYGNEHPCSIKVGNSLKAENELATQEGLYPRRSLSRMSAVRNTKVTNLCIYI